MPRSYRLGRDLLLVGEAAGEVLLEGQARLAPGRVAVLLSSDRLVSRRAVFITDWRLVGLRASGPIYRGRGRTVEVGRSGE